MTEKNKTKKGFTLIETLIAISVFSLAVVSLITVLGGGVSGINFAQNKVTASYLAQEGIESIRNMRDSHTLFGGGLNWDSFKNELSSCVSEASACGFDSSLSARDGNFVFSCGDCRLFLQNGAYGVGPSGTVSPFTRKIWRDVISDNEIKIYSKVYWTEGSGQKSVLLQEHLFNWVE